MSDNESPELNRVREAARALGEHFETVQIFVTRTNDGSEGGGSLHIHSGFGNWFARYGQVKMWCLRCEGGEMFLDMQNGQNHE